MPGPNQAMNQAGRRIPLSAIDAAVTAKPDPGRVGDPQSFRLQRPVRRTCARWRQFRQGCRRYHRDCGHRHY